MDVDDTYVDALLYAVPNEYQDDEDELDNTFWEDIRECGNGKDSDQEGDVSLLHNDAVHAKTMLLTSGKIIDDDEDCIDEVGVPSEQYTAAEGVELESVSAAKASSSIWNAPSGWKAHAHRRVGLDTLQVISVMMLQKKRMLTIQGVGTCSHSDQSTVATRRST